MNTMTSILQTFAAIAGGLAALMSILLFIRLRWPAPVLLFCKLYTTALSTLLSLVGLLCAIVGLVTGSVLIALIGIYDALIFLAYIFRVTRPPAASGSFHKAFGLNWESYLSPEQKRHFLPRRFVFKLPSLPDPQASLNISFARIPGTHRDLLCDVWQPPKNITPSGLAFIYLHGSAFYLLDKDYGTRPLFRYLAAQGHTIMDVAYRLSPETDVMGMVHDVKRAITWIKENARHYNIDPDCVVVAGGSSGGHLALLTAYTSNKPTFTPQELEGKNTEVCAVLSFYGSSDMSALYYHTNQHLTTRDIRNRFKKSVPTKIPGWMIRRMGEDYHRLGFDKGLINAGALAPLLGGHPRDCPEAYTLFSAITHVHRQCPPTYLIHGDHDIMAPVTSTRALFARLQEEQVPAVMHILPQTEHVFDLILPVISPPAHMELYEVERFLALQVKRAEKHAMASRDKEEPEIIH